MHTYTYEATLLDFLRMLRSALDIVTVMTIVVVIILSLFRLLLPVPVLVQVLVLVLISYDIMLYYIVLHYIAFILEATSGREGPPGLHRGPPPDLRELDHGEGYVCMYRYAYICIHTYIYIYIYTYIMYIRICYVCISLLLSLYINIHIYI